MKEFLLSVLPIVLCLFYSCCFFFVLPVEAAFYGDDPCSFSYPYKCVDILDWNGEDPECIYQASWDHHPETDLVTFDISISNPEGDRWLAIGFSNDRLMV